MSISIVQLAKLLRQIMSQSHKALSLDKVGLKKEKADVYPELLLVNKGKQLQEL